MSILDKIKAKKAGSTAPATVAKVEEPKKRGRKPGAKTEVKETPAPAVVGRGRPKGVKFVVSDKNQEVLTNNFTSAEKAWKSVETNLMKFIEAGNKSAAKACRKAIQDLKRAVGDLRKSVQEAKESMTQEPV